MKNLLVTCLAGFLITTTANAAQPAFQTGADQFNEIIRCQPLVLQPDFAMKVTVQTGGIAGLTQIKISRLFHDHTSTQTYTVKALTRPEAQSNEGITLVSSDIRMTVNFNSQTPAGGNYGVLKVREQSGTSTAELSCELVLQNPQVNYAY